MTWSTRIIAVLLLIFAASPARAITVDATFAGLLGNGQSYEISFFADVAVSPDGFVFDGSAPGFETTLSVLIDGVEEFTQDTASVFGLFFDAGDLSGVIIGGDNLGDSTSIFSAPDFYFEAVIDPLFLSSPSRLRLVVGSTSTPFLLPKTVDLAVSSTVIPLPAPLLLLLSALAGLAAMVRMRRLQPA